jgi:hypothetical protein
MGLMMNVSLTSLAYPVRESFQSQAATSLNTTSCDATTLPAHGSNIL